jgi:hypothetical protein
MSFERKALPDRTEARQESLCVFRIPKATHLPLAFTRRMMTVFSPVIHPGTGSDENVVDVGQFGFLGLSRRTMVFLSAAMIGAVMALEP